MLTRALALLLALSVAAAGAQTWRLHSLRTDIALDRAAQAAADRADARAAVIRNQEIDRATQTNINAARVAAAAARTDADGLRDALAATAQFTPAAPSCAAEQATTARLAGLLGQAAGLVAECQERGGALATQVTGLQQATEEKTHE